MKRRKKNSLRSACLIIIMIMASAIGLALSADNKERPAPPEPASDSHSAVNTPTEGRADRPLLQIDSLPDNLIELLEKNPETRDFVLNYPLKKDAVFEIDLSEHLNSSSVPLFMQWDERWGYTHYAGELMGISGCGPTCLSMVCVYLLHDADYTPKYIAEFAERNGFSVSGNGSSWTLISDGGEALGLDITEIPLVESRIINNLEVGNPIICVMGPGDFTTTGHFIVMTEYVDGNVKINDPNSKIRSEKLWNLSDIAHQIRNLWVCRT